MENTNRNSTTSVAASISNMEHCIDAVYLMFIEASSNWIQRRPRSSGSGPVPVWNVYSTQTSVYMFAQSRSRLPVSYMTLVCCLTANCRCSNTSANSQDYTIIISDTWRRSNVYWAPLSHADWCLLSSRLDYWNSTRASLAMSTIAHLQRIQNVAVCLVCGLGPCDHVTKYLHGLHWLPIRFCIMYKLCLMMHNVHTGSLAT